MINTNRWVGNVWRARVTVFKTQLAVSTLLTGALLLALFIAFMAAVQFSTPDLPDNDGFYHIKMASLMGSQGLKPDFPWLPLTILNPREFYNHHFLFHVLLIPFTTGNLLTGAKWAAVLFASLAFLLTWRLLDRQKVPYSPLWALGLVAVSEAFIYRMSITRAQSLSLALLVVGTLWLLEGKHKRLALLGFIYVWFYNAFPLLLAITAVYVAAVWLVERRLDGRPLLYSAIGIAAGLILNPYFPYNLIFIVQHILPKLLDATAISVGNEWFPYTTGQLLSNSPLALAVFVAGCLGLGLAGRKMDVRTMTAFLLACLFGLMLFQSRRFIEYFPAFALIFAAFAWAPVITDFRRRPDPSPDEPQKLPVFARLRPALAALVMIAILLPGAWLTLQDARDSLRGSKPYQLYAGASAWLQANTAPGERVFQTDWDDFPRLFFYNTHNTYLVGLDPTYMQFYDAALYDTWVEITRGNVEQPSGMIVSTFGARYVVSDLQHGGFMRQAEADPRIIEVYRDEDAVVYQVIDP